MGNGTQSAPPEFAIRAAVEAGARSPCAKSKRGAAVYFGGFSGDWLLFGVGCNAQPDPFVCSGTDRCRDACGKLCEHAEQVAIRNAQFYVLRLPDRTDPNLGGCQLVHAKVVNGLIVPGGGPSCWQCSRLVLGVGLDGVWLYEGPDGRRPEHYRCTTCSALMTRDGEFEEYQHAGCLGLVERVGTWRYYTAEEFHHATLKACGIETP